MPNFINRIDELEFIADQAAELAAKAEENKSCAAPIVHVLGDGGIGKTRFSQELPKVFEKRSIALEIIKICDFDDRSLFVADNLELWLLSNLDKSRSQEVRNEFRVYQAMKDRGDSQVSLQLQRERIMREMVRVFGETPRMLRFDTVEKLTYDLRNRLCTFINLLENVLVVMAGRPGVDHGIAASLDPIVKTSRYFPLKLEPFEFKVGEQYIHQAELERSLKIPNKLIGPLLRLTGGKPILIDLAIEYVARSVEIDPLLTIDVAEFDDLTETEQKSLQHQFEEKLVTHISNLSGRMDRLILILSRVYPLTAHGIASLLNISLDEALLLFSEAQSYAFIKTLPKRDALGQDLGAVSISLQDVMRELVNQYVWEKADPNGRRRKRDSRLITKTYKQLDNRLHELLVDRVSQIEAKESVESWEEFIELRALEQERELVTEIWLEHSLYASLEAGMEEWSKLIDKVRRGRKYDLAIRLCNLAKPYYERDRLTSTQTVDYRFTAARAEIDKTEYRKAEKEFLELQQEESARARLPQIHNMLGVVYRNLGLFEKALQHQKISLSLLESQLWWERANVENQIGYLYRLLEDHDQKNLQEAQIHFENVRQSCLTHNRESRKLGLEKANKTLLGGACNNLGYVEGLQGNYARAFQLLNLSVEIFSAAERHREISWPETHMGILARDQGRFDYAIRILNRAINRLSLPDDHKELCRAYFHLGWSQWFKAFEVPSVVNTDMLAIARNSLEESREIADANSYRQEQPGIYHQLATVTWQLGLFEDREILRKEGRKLNRLAMQFCQELNNIRYGIDAMIGEMEFDLVDYPGDYQKLRSTFTQVKQVYSDFSFPLYYGRGERILGDCAIFNSNYDAALRHYQVAIPLMNSHGGYGPYSIDVELDNLGDKVQALPVEMAAQWIRIFSAAWGKSNIGHADLLDWCDAQQMRNQLR